MKKAFTLLELIFMIVVIALLTPTIILLTQRSIMALEEFQHTTYYANGYSQMNLITRKLWDTNNQNDILTAGQYYVLWGNSNDANNTSLDCNIDNNGTLNGNYRLGHYKGQNRRKCSVSMGADRNITSTLGLDTGETLITTNWNDIDDFNNVTQRVVSTNNFSTEEQIELDTLNKPSTTETLSENISFLNDLLKSNINETSATTIDASIDAIALAKGLTAHKVLLRKWLIDKPTLKMETKINFVNYSRNGQEIIVTDENVTAGKTTPIKKVTITITDLVNKNIDTRKVIEYFYYTTNIGTDVPFVKVNK